VPGDIAPGEFVPNLHDLASTIFLLFTLTLLAGSVSIWIQIVRRQWQDPPAVPGRFRNLQVAAPRFTLLLVLAWLALLLGSPPDKGDPDLILSLVQYLVVVSVLAISIGISVWGESWTATVSGRQRFQRAEVVSRARFARLGFHCDRPLEQLRDGAIGFLAALLPVMTVLLISTPLRSEESMHTYLRQLRELPFGHEQILILLIAVVLAPVSEELMFRVVLQTWFREFLPARWAIVCCSLLFAAVHNFPDSLAIFPLALVLGTLFERRRSYLAIVTLHALFNGYNLLGTFAGMDP
jgi:membrane protease YdiL (CAAX protease family)